ncbi:conserved hypothetical protein [Methylobacterium nodulans ORS 2060]|uniref:Uncharacterized protein n=2 Tax=Methylobacterium nodulans TaxID=114616 RepID=B8IUD0_METNO|nr:conserved hypothetical protein [Methylobacterium nodulans ORS 2060]
MIPSGYSRTRAVAGGFLMSCLLAGPVAAIAHEAGQAEAEIDSEHLFGFTEGSDIGVPGERELEQETTARIGRLRAGVVRAIDPTLALKLPLSSDFRIAPGLSFSHFDLAATPGLPVRGESGFNGGFVETRLRLLDRRTAPIGLTLSVVPSIGTIDGGSGLAARAYGVEAALLADREIIPGLLVGALNLNLGLARAEFGGGETVRSSGLEVSGALAYRVRPWLFLGGELRYARAYEGLGLDRFAGAALYLGPTLYAALSEGAWMSFTWGVQVAGGAAADPRPLDLTNFDRHQLRLRVGLTF